MARCFHPAFTGFAAAAVLLQPAATRAQEGDSEVRIELSAEGEVAADAQARFDVEKRLLEGADEYVIGAVVDVAVAEAVTLGGGLEIHDAGGYTEIRPYQQLTLEHGDLSFRTRLEERFFDNADQVSFRLRQRAQFSPALSRETQAMLAAEIFYQLRDHKEDGPKRIDQWRFSAGLRHRIAPALDLAVAYTLQIRPRPEGQTRHTHVPQLTLAYGF